jgi:hypothetical protein
MISMTVAKLHAAGIYMGKCVESFELMKSAKPRTAMWVETGKRDFPEPKLLKFEDQSGLNRFLANTRGIGLELV